jgi:ApaG protein
MNEKNNIMINAEAFFIAEQSQPENNRYVFAYTVTIVNEGSISCQLLSRYWLITDAGGKTQTVKGPGVVGEQPYLKPGESFRYTSGAILETPVGVMQGYYSMYSDDGENFDAIIPQFTLSIPRILH